MMRVILNSCSDDHFGLAVVRSLGRSGIDHEVISTSPRPLAAYSRFCKKVTTTPDFFNHFRNLPSDTIVFPMHEDLMLRLAAVTPDLKCTLAFSDLEVIETIINKNKMVAYAQNHDFPGPNSMFIRTLQDLESFTNADEPCVIRLNRSAGGKGILFADTREDLMHKGAQALLHDGPFMIQEKIPFSYKCNVGVLCNRDAKIRRICMLKEIRNYPVETGQSCCVETFFQQDLFQLCEKILGSLNYYGIADIDFLMDSRDNKPKFMEINPRFWGSLQGAIGAGVDFPALLYQMVIEGDVPASFEYRSGIRYRYLLFDDLSRVLSVLQGNFPGRYKIRTAREFLDIIHDDGYYVLCRDDLKPFFGLLTIKIKRFLQRKGIRE